MTGVVARAWSKVTNVGMTPGVGRNFLRCHDCRRVVPAWRLVREKLPKGERIGCTCGSTLVRGTFLGDWHAAWWVLVVGVLWRRTILRQSDWDPRIPTRLQ